MHPPRNGDSHREKSSTDSLLSLAKDSLPAKRPDPIAIIGIGCLFPGARGPQAFWRLMQQGVDAISEIPAERFDIDAHYDPTPGVPGKIMTRYAGFVSDVDKFDPAFFGISPREAVSMDPQQRLLLETAWEALEDAGLVPSALVNSPTGVFIGMCASDYGDLQLHFGDPSNLDVYSVPGSARSILSGRLSYILNLQGPSVALDTACSSSLVAIHLACHSLWSGECTLALAGGVNLLLMPETFAGFSMARMLAPDGHCKAFDARADGFVRSEGAGVVVLKPLSVARADGDPIYAVIRGSAANNDGRSSGMMMPSQKAQAEVLRAAYQHAGVLPKQIQYIEAHGTGTGVGDPIEATAIGTVLKEGRSPDQPCRIGSVKTNIGHLEGAAGVAGLIKVALALKHKAIPPSLHFETPNPHIPWEELPLVVQRELTPWPVSDEPALAGVSSFGISGTNVHVVLEEAPASLLSTQDTASTDTACLFPLSAHTPDALASSLQKYRDFLANDAALSSLHDICYNASVRRTHHSHRLAFVAHSREELAEQLATYAQGELRAAVAAGAVGIGQDSKLVFVFSGQGPKFWPLDPDLLAQEPVFRVILEQCEALLQKYNMDWSLLEQLTIDGQRSRLHETDVCQAAIFAVQVALAALWRSWGIEPAAVVGHSLGEVAAAHVAGALTLEDAIHVIYHRGRVTKKASGQGRMALVGLPMEKAQAALAGYEDRLAVAVSNSPTTCVLSGDPTALTEVLYSLQQQGTFYRELPAVDYAAHSPQMDPLKVEISQALEVLQPRPAAVPLFSTVTGKAEQGESFGASYWGDNLREPVRFSDTLQELLQQGHDIFLEIHPHQVLSRAIQEGFEHTNRKGTVLSSLQKGAQGRVMLLNSLGTLYTAGISIDWRALYPNGGRHVSIPTASWQRERYWLPVNNDGNHLARRRASGQESRHPLLGWRVSSAAQPGSHLLETKIGVAQIPYLADHRVQGLMVLPAAAYVEMALAAVGEMFSSDGHILEKIEFQKALFLPENGSQMLQLVVSQEMPETVSIQFYSRPGSATDPPSGWTLHASGTVRLAPPDAADIVVPSTRASFTEFKSRATQTVAGPDHYQAMAKRGLDYGPVFQGIGEIWRQDGEALAQLNLPEAVAAASHIYHIHPALLDTCFQAVAAAVPQHAVAMNDRDTFLPVSLARFRIHQSPTGNLFAHAVLRLPEESKGDQLVGDVFLTDEAGNILVEALGLTLQRLGLAAGVLETETADQCLYEVHWQQQENLEPEPAPSASGSWLLFMDQGRLGKALAQRLAEQGEACITVAPANTYRRVYKQNGRAHFRLDPNQPEEVRKLLADCLDLGYPPLRGIIYLWGIETSSTEMSVAALDAAHELGCFGLLHLVQALAQTGWSQFPRLWLVTRGTQVVEADDEAVAPAQAPLWGLGRVIANEHPELRCSAIDLATTRSRGETERLLHEIWVNGGENQVALRGKKRYVARLVRFAPHREEKRRPAVPGEAYQLEVRTPGILDNLMLHATERQVLAPGQVEIKVQAAGLNFLDVLSALGIRPDQDGNPLVLGMECAGIVSAVGEGVEDVQIGDEVMAVAPYSFSAYTRTLAPFVVPKPKNLSFEEAATIPVAFLTAHYALNYLGRLRKGERVLIHAAAGGVGLAAVRLAQRTGAEIFATAGSPEKRDFLRSLGVEHVMDSRSLAFADEVMKITHGEGIDMVLNSLAGEAIPKSLSVLRANGRFLEIGKRDIYQHSKLDMGHFKKNIAFFAIDLIPMFADQAAFCGEMLRDLARFLEDGSLAPLNYTVFPISRVDDAFRYMAQAKHIGKIVLSMEDENLLIAPATHTSFRADGTYLITGGLGGLGLSVAQWMVERGARHLVLLGRRAPSPAATEAIAAMTATGAQVVPMQADVAQEEQVARVIATIDRTLPLLRGIIHAAGVLDDGILLQLNPERFRNVMAPKVKGAWILHHLTQDRKLDLFVLFSSVASIVGSPGQGNYVAANAFLDALAHHRHLQGQPALSINWGAWAEVGLAARADRASHVLQQGILPFTPQQGVQLLEQILRYDPVQITAMSIDWAKLLSVFSPPLLAQIAAEVKPVVDGATTSQTQDGALRQKLMSVAPSERQGAVETFLREQIAKVLRSATDKLDVHQPLDQLGVDSLMAYELKNRVEADLNLTLPVAALLQGPSITKLTQTVLEQLDMAEAPPPAVVETIDEATTEQLLSQVDQLSDQEIESMLQELLEEEISAG